MSHPFHERGVALATHDLLIDAARLGGAQRLAADHLAVDRELQVAEGGVLRQWEDVIRFPNQPTAIDEAFLYFIAENAVAQLDAHVTARADDLLTVGQTFDDRTARHRARTAGNQDSLCGSDRRYGDREEDESSHVSVGW